MIKETMEMQTGDIRGKNLFFPFLVVYGALISALGILFGTFWLLLLVPAILLALPLRLAALSSLMVFLVPFNVVREGPFDLPFAMELIKFPAFFLLLAQLLTKRAKFRIPREYALPLAMLLAVMVLAVARAEVPFFTIKLVARMLGNVLVFLFVLNVLKTSRHLSSFVRAMLISAALVSLYGMYQFLIGDFGFGWSWINQRFESDFSPGHDEFWGWRNRSMSFLTSENELAGYLNLCIPFALCRLLAPAQKNRGIYVALLVVLLGCLVLTFSFGGWIGGICGIVTFFVMAFPHQRRRILVSGLVLLMVCLGVYFLPIFQYQLADRLSQFDWSLERRIDSWSLALDYFKGNPLIGIGYGNFTFRSIGFFRWLNAPWLGGLGSSPHNIYVTELAEMGLLGFVALNWLLVHTALTGFRLFRQVRNSEAGWFALAASCSMITVMIHGFVEDSALFSAHSGYLVWMLVGLQQSIAGLGAEGLAHSRINTKEVFVPQRRCGKLYA